MVSFIEKREGAKEAPTRDDLHSRDPSLLDGVDPEELSDRCKPYSNIDESVEFVTPIDKAKPVKNIGSAIENQAIYNAVHDVEKNHPDKFIGLHVTQKRKAKSIMARGFSESKANERSVAIRGFRDGAVFAWHAIWDITIGVNQAGVLTVAPRDSVIVSNMPATVTHQWQEYVELHTMPYPDFVHCLRKHGPNTVLLTEKDIIQDISDYRPEVPK